MAVWRSLPTTSCVLPLTEDTSRWSQGDPDGPNTNQCWLVLSVITKDRWTNTHRCTHTHTDRYTRRWAPELVWKGVTSEKHVVPAWWAICLIKRPLSQSIRLSARESCAACPQSSLHCALWMTVPAPLLNVGHVSVCTFWMHKLMLICFWVSLCIDILHVKCVTVDGLDRLYFGEFPNQENCFALLSLGLMFIQCV